MCVPFWAGSLTNTDVGSGINIELFKDLLRMKPVDFLFSADGSKIDPTIGLAVAPLIHLQSEWSALLKRSFLTIVLQTLMTNNGCIVFYSQYDDF